MKGRQFSLRMLFAAVAAAAIVLWLYQLGRLGPPMLFTLGAFFVLVVFPIFLVGQPDAVKSITAYAAIILCFGGLCFFIAHLMLIYC